MPRLRYETRRLSNNSDFPNGVFGHTTHGPWSVPRAQCSHTPHLSNMFPSPRRSPQFVLAAFSGLLGEAKVIGDHLAAYRVVVLRPRREGLDRDVLLLGPGEEVAE